MHMPTTGLLGKQTLSLPCRHPQAHQTLVVHSASHAPQPIAVPRVVTFSPLWHLRVKITKDSASLTGKPQLFPSLLLRTQDQAKEH
jgi:hypothetical protein